MNKLLEDAIETIRTLPDEEQELAAEMLRIIAARANPPYVMSPEEQVVVEHALAEADRGEFASEEEVQAILHTPWR